MTNKTLFLDAFCGAGGASTGIMQAGCDVTVAINHDFAVFTNTPHPIKWPVPTHSKEGAGGLQKWMPCRDILDMEDLGPSIFTGRKGRKPLAVATLKRIRHGLNRHGSEAMIDIKATKSVPKLVSRPMPTVKAHWHYSLVNATMIDAGGFRATPTGIAQPLRTIMASRDQALIHAFICNSHFANASSALEEPLKTIVAARKQPYLCAFLTNSYGSSLSGSTATPCGTITATPKASLAHAFLIKYYSGDKASHSISVPLGTVTTRDRFAKICLVPCAGIKEYVLQPAPKPTAQGHVIIPAWTRIDNGYLVSNNILDIHYRGLKPSEIKLAQGFAADYKLDAKSKSRQNKQLGNAVHVQCAKVLVQANCGPGTSYHHTLNQNQ